MGNPFSSTIDNSLVLDIFLNFDDVVSTLDSYPFYLPPIRNPNLLPIYIILLFMVKGDLFLEESFQQRKKRRNFLLEFLYEKIEKI